MGWQQGEGSGEGGRTKGAGAGIVRKGSKAAVSLWLAATASQLPGVVRCGVVRCGVVPCGVM